MTNTHPWRFDMTSSPTAVRDVLDDIANRCTQAHLGDTLQINAQIVLGEVLNNIVEHAYSERDGHPIQLTIVPGPEELQVYVIDQGIAMPEGRPPNPPMPSLDTDDLPEGGFGWALVRKMTRDMTYRRDAHENHLSFAISGTD